MNEFARFFKKTTGYDQVRNWQAELASSIDCGNRLIRIPTGFGKTLGVLAAWTWHRLIEKNPNWPRRLVWCLPMRVLVEQTEREVRTAFERLGVLWDEKGAHNDKFGVHLLMGGADGGRWYLYPESDTVLIGTQDMLLSRAMNRGYASPRARWPTEFGLLNQDALWVMDEVQLMDAGLATSGQLQVFRNEDLTADKALRPCFTWWMSATLQQCWLEKSPDTKELSRELARNTYRIRPGDRTGHLWDAVYKPMSIHPFSNVRALARDISERHRSTGCGRAGPTLVVLNTVERATDTWKMLRVDKALVQSKTDIRLAHSRFRPSERQTWRDGFLDRAACVAGTNRIIVSTQVIEAGVDFSAYLLFTEIAPWSSLVQRFGRCARWGGEGQVIVADLEHDSDKKAAPYSLDDLNAAREACKSLQDVGPIYLERFEEENERKAPDLYPYEPSHLLIRHELDELFDTSPDLSGSDIDISRFIRSGDERDVQVFWADIDGDAPPSHIKPTRFELCCVPFLRVRDWLCKPKPSESLKDGTSAWIWDWLGCEWRKASRRDIYPGQTVLVDCRVGGYRSDRGWDPKSTCSVEPAVQKDSVSLGNRLCWARDGDSWRPSERQVRVISPEDFADDTEDDESLSVTGGWQTIASHGLQVAHEVQRIASQVAPAEARLLHLAGRWHDLGKVHAAFQRSIQADNRPEREDIAKAPDIAWPCSPGNMYRIDESDQRRGFRHELASTLGLFGVLQRYDPHHPALLGPWRDWFGVMGETGVPDDLGCGTLEVEPSAVEQEILDLSAGDFDLLAYLVCAHHGKVRMAWHSSPADQNANDTRLRIRGIREGDVLPSLLVSSADGRFHQVRAAALDLSPSEAGLSPRTGRSWTERVLNLVERFGPFSLAWLEALLRAADQRASSLKCTDKLLQKQEDDDVRHALVGSHRTVAQATGERAPAPASGGDSPSRGELHGDGGRAGGRGLDSGTTRPPHSATRYIETRVGILSYQELAPLLAERVAETELAISNREFANLSVHELVLELHRGICSDLTPDMAGRWRLRDVRVGEHQAPPHWQVSMLMRNYAADVDTRLQHSGDIPGDRLIADLAFAEGRLLHIHPFEDFNGRVSRLFLIELLYRLNLPVVDPAASSPEGASQYFAALRAFDRHDPRPLSAIWRHRFAQGTPR